MSNSPPSQRDRRNLQDLAKLASSSKTPAPAAVAPVVTEHDSGIVDLKAIAQMDQAGADRAKTTPLAAAPLFEDETPAVVPPSSTPPPPAVSSGPKSGAPSAPPSAPVAATPSPVRGAATAAVAGPAEAPGGKGTLTWVLVGLGAAVVAAGVVTMLNRPKPVAGAQDTASPPPSAALAPVAPPPSSAAPVAAVSSPSAVASAVASASPSAPDTPRAGGGVTVPSVGGRKGPGGAASKGPAVEGAGGSTVSALSAMMAQSTNSTPTPPVTPGALGAAVEHAVGGGGAPGPAAAPEGPAAPAFAPGSVPQKPSQGAVTGALLRATPGARACLNAGDAPSRANVTFSSSGSVTAVVVTGPAAGNPEEECIKKAMMKASVPPFSQDSYSANVNIRPN